MRPNHNQKRSRGRAAGRRNGPNRHQNFDSNGPNVRIRGTAHQVHEKYLTLARDAASSGDRVMAENLLQHADHYYRLLNEAAENRENRQGNGQDRQAGRGRGNGAQRDGSINGSDESRVPTDAVAVAEESEEADAVEAAVTPDGADEADAGEATVKKPGAELAEAALAAAGEETADETEPKPVD